MKRKLLYALLFSSIVIVTGCGGGGGGGTSPGGSPYPSGNPYLRTEVPYSAPVLAAVVAPFAAITNRSPVYETYTANIDNSGGDNLIIAGRDTQPSTPSTWVNSKISMLGWSNGQLVDKTAQWFTGGSNIILGTDPTLQFADFFHSGRTDMFVAPSTDMNLYGPAYLYQNTGSTFNRITIPLNNVWGHGATIADLDNDGYTDFAITDYGRNFTVGINNRVDNFRTYVQAPVAGNYLDSSSSVAVGDFLQNGTKQLVFTDTQCSYGPCTSAATKMFSYTLNNADLTIQLNYLSTLPTPRFELPKWASYNFGISHNVLAVTYDFVGNGIPSLIIFSAPSSNNLPNAKFSEIQFLKNDGRGNFIDVTDTTLVGYNTNTYTTYNPKFVDLNSDGLTDILVSGFDYSGANNSTQFLLRSRDGKYVAAYQNIMTDFLTQVNSIQGTANANNTVNVVRGAGGKLFLVSTASYLSNGNRQLGVYLSDLGAGNVTTAQTAVNLIKQAWPYMTDVQANLTLAKTSPTYMTDAGSAMLLDPDAWLKPIGSLSLSNPSRIGSMMPITGYISGIQLDNTNAVAMDSMGRGFNVNLRSMNSNGLNAFGYNTEHIDQYELTSHAEYLINGNTVTLNNMRIGAEGRNAGNTWSGKDEGPGMLTKPTQYTVGIPEIYRNGNISYGAQYTSLNTHPFLAFGGAWGNVTNSGVLDNVVSYRKNGFSASASLMYVTTNIQPGLVTKVSDITGGWAETGYRYTEDKLGDIGLYMGVKPVVFSGQVETKMPTSIDNNGNTVYTKQNYGINNAVTPYVRALYTNMIDKKTMYRLSGTALSNGQYRVMNEMRFFFD